jgi:hypothetical protein
MPQEYSPFIRFNAIAPGFFLTELNCRDVVQLALALLHRARTSARIVCDVGRANLTVLTRQYLPGLIGIGQPAHLPADAGRLQ